MQVKTTAKLNNLRMSPQKVRLVAGLIRGLDVQEALNQLSFSSKNAALPVKKLLKSAIANAKHNDNVKEDTLKVETITVDEGKTLHRWMPRAMGRATPLRKRSSHITIVLSGIKEEKAKPAKKTETAKKEEKAKPAKKTETKTKVKKTKTNLKEKNNK